MKRNWDLEELIEHWTLLPQELELLAYKTEANRYVFALLLKFFQYYGRFPQQKSEISPQVIEYMGKQLPISPQCLTGYNWRGRTIKAYRSEIRTFLGFRQATDEDLQQLKNWLQSQILAYELKIEALSQVSLSSLKAQKIEAPSPKSLERLVRSACHQFELDFCQKTAQRLSSSVRENLAQLLEIATSDESENGETSLSLLTQLKSESGNLGIESWHQEANKLQQLRQLELPEDLFDPASYKLIQIYRQRVALESPSQIRRHQETKRYTYLAAFCWLRHRELTDHLVEFFLQIVHRMGIRAERQVDKELLNDFKQVKGKTHLLFKIAEAALAHPDGQISEVIYPIAGEETLRNLIKEAQSSGATYREKVYKVMRSSYGHHYRRILPLLLNLLAFKSNNDSHQPLIQALELLKKYVDSKLRDYPSSETIPLEGVVPPSWRELMVGQDTQEDETVKINRINYELAVLQGLRNGLRCKEIWVVGADRYRNPEQDLPNDFETRREVYYQALSQPTDAETFILQLQHQMKASLSELDAGLSQNPHVQILSKNKGWIRLSPLKALPEPLNLTRLKTAIEHHWPTISLLDILKETDLRVNFSQFLTSPASHERINPLTLQKRLLICLYGLGTNTGLRRLSLKELGESYSDLIYVRRRYLHPTQLRHAISEIVNATFAVRLPEIWGEGTTTCASDSKKFGAWDENLLAEWHLRYGGRGVMIYWHVERNSACIYSQLKSCSSSEVAAMIEGVLRHCTQMKVEKNFVDSHGQSEIAFAFSYLLGFELMPRLKGIHRQKLFRPIAGQPDAYPHLQEILTRPIHWELIRQQYDQMIKYATALRLGTAETEAILDRFTRQNLTHPTYRALGELGKALKTIFLCQYLHSEPLRREINEGLNVVESWNSASDFIFYGKGREITSNHREDQEISVLALHLLQSCLVYINTLMIQQVLSQPEWRQLMQSEDFRGLTPLFWSHINPYGTFRLDLTERLPLDWVA